MLRHPQGAPAAPREFGQYTLLERVSGRKAFQSVTRQNLPRFEIEDGRLKINPLGDWTKEDLEVYCAEHDRPRHPLEEQGYLSIGCEPCSS